jgi:hypothetical protein
LQVDGEPNADVFNAVSGPSHADAGH